MDLSKQLKTNLNFRNNIINMTELEIKKLTGLSFDNIRTLKLQALLLNK
tara:strand:+ start:330 stop:476 length:147 start_codon:yes stop_codon:yes gene_type:complete